jgi:hypothetical protein
LPTEPLDYGEDRLVVTFSESGQLGLEGVQDGISRRQKPLGERGQLRG